MTTGFASIKFNVDAGGRGTLELNGIDVSKHCDGFDISVRTGELTRVTLNMPANVQGAAECLDVEMSAVCKPGWKRLRDWFKRLGNNITGPFAT